MKRSGILIVLALLLAGFCLWLFSRLLTNGAAPWWFLLPGFGFAAAWIIGQQGLAARQRER